MHPKLTCFFFSPKVIALGIAKVGWHVLNLVHKVKRPALNLFVCFLNGMVFGRAFHWDKTYLRLFRGGEWRVEGGGVTGCLWT